METDLPLLIDSAPVTLDEFREIVEAGSAGVFAVVDSCDEPTVPEKVSELGDEQAISLYRGWAEREHQFIAPYLFAVDSDVFEWIVAQVWDNPWGFLLLAPNGTLDTLRKQFRRYLTIETPDGEQLYFRFYDPRVLTTYLQTCHKTELREFFGDAESILMTNQEGGLDQIRIK